MSEVNAKSTEIGAVNFKFPLEKKGRDFEMFSIHPNGEEWLFTECSTELNSEGDCYVFNYNIISNKLQRYALPEGYLYGYANFSPKGNYILMSRAPKHDRSEVQITRSVEDSEIVMMRSDGTDFTVLPLKKGSKLAPFMSKDETKIAYWRSGIFREAGSKSISADFDVCEYDLNEKKDHLFAGPYHFFSGGNSQYISEGEILLGSYGPAKYGQSMGEYLKRHNGSEIYIIQRKSADLPTPSLIEVENARNPSIDEVGNIYLTGQKLPKFGSSFFKKSLDGEISLWQEPVNLTALRQVNVAPNGQYMAFIYAADGTNFRDQKSAFGRLNFENSQWVPVSIPALRDSILLSVRFKNK
ncbi:hypothetical protein AAKU55_004252 [Oxalobacteraceae bacterium GrIS 1.11]